MSTISQIVDDPAYAYLAERPSRLLLFCKKLFEIYCRTVFLVYCPLTVRGKENIPASSFIFCSNHNSHMDIAILMASWKQNFRHYGMLAAKDYWFDDRLKKFLTNIILTLIPIERNREGRSRLTMDKTLEFCRTFISMGERNLIFFPEGTRSIDGEIGPFKKGAASFALRLGIPIVPVHISGTHAAWPKGRYFMKPKRISVIIGEPLHGDRYIRDVNPNVENSESLHYQAVQEMTEDLARAVRQLGERNHA